jgi:hypothetical protein
MAGLPRQVSSFDFYAQRCRWTAAAGLATAFTTYEWILSQQSGQSAGSRHSLCAELCAEFS